VQTFIRFAFKSSEKKENFIKLIMKDDHEIKKVGSMLVTDLWAEKNITQFLNENKMDKNKMLLEKLSSYNKRFEVFKKLKPVFMTRKEEVNLANEIYMKNQSK